jgi:3-oxoadipate enol-lactonase
MTMAAARWEEFELHCRAAVRGGVPVEVIRETLMQGAVYCGVPAANTAIKLARAILRDEGVVLAAAPLSAPHRVAVHHTFSVPQLRVALQGIDSGIPVMLSHALGIDLSMWDGLAASLAPQHPLLRYDHRGHGGSAVPAGPYAMDELVDDAARLVREWGRGPVVFVGLSMGGMVGQGLAIRYPDLVRALLLANTIARQPTAAQPVWAERIAAVQASGLGAVVDGTLERWFTAAFRQTHAPVVDGVRRRLLQGDVQGYIACSHAVAAVDWLDRLASIRCPTLVLAGEHDVGATPEMGRAIAERIPSARFELMNDVAHLSVVEQPAVFERHLRSLLDTLA